MSDQAGQDVGRLLADVFADHQVVDLSVPLAEQLPYAPRHFIPPVWSGLPNAGVAGDIGVDQLPLLAAAGPADVIDVGDISAEEQTPAGVSPRVTPRHLERWEAEHGPVAAGDVVLLHSGWDRHYLEGPAGSRYGTDVLVDAVAPGWPAPTPKAVDWLLDRGVRCVGTGGPGRALAVLPGGGPGTSGASGEGRL